MRSSVLLSAASGLALAAAQAPQVAVDGKLGPAAVISDNPTGVTYVATLPDSRTSGIRGTVSATAGENGLGVQFTINVSGFPDSALGPFMYHLHDQPVPANGNCTATKAHLDPYERGEVPLCAPGSPQTCQVGDLSGKHGNITGGSYASTYLDLYASVKPGIGAFFGNRSIVFHTSNATRLTCANFVLSNATSNTTTPSTGTNGSSTTSPPITSYTGAASATVASLSVVVLGVAASLFL
ncbi:MAG: hypothetical protein M1817_004152 [Caeruleum heppii]|nr:MAG: hypothetical protein M1817_004152 [Caeruleum heppii]